MKHDADRPRARTNDLVVEELGDELLVYDRRSDVAHCLGPMAAKVWRACDGSNDLHALAGQADTEIEATVAEALSELREKDLLADGTGSSGSPVTRREAVVRMAGAGAAAATAPLIVSVLAPKPADAQTACRPEGFSPCNATTRCCSGIGNCTGGGKCKQQ